MKAKIQDKISNLFGRLFQKDVSVVISVFNIRITHHPENRKPAKIYYIYLL